MPVFDEVAQRYDPWYATPPGCFADEVVTATASPLLDPPERMTWEEEHRLSEMNTDGFIEALWQKRKA